MDKNGKVTVGAIVKDIGVAQRFGKIGEESYVALRMEFGNLTQMLELQDEISRAIRDTIKEYEHIYGINALDELKRKLID